jgi:hypothetical protein
MLEEGVKQMEATGDLVELKDWRVWLKILAAVKVSP